jgi:hypothetical protein
MAGKSFYEILREEVRKEVLTELSAEFQVAGAAPISEPTAQQQACDKNQVASENLELWLASHVSTKGFRPKAKNAYQSPKPFNQASAEKQTPLLKSAPRRELNAEEVIALEFFKRQGSILQNDFSEADLKTAFRKIALRTHPDRNMDKPSVERIRLQETFTHAHECTEVLLMYIESCEDQSVAA